MLMRDFIALLKDSAAKSSSTGSIALGPEESREPFTKVANGVKTFYR
jgi:hypothetical protein